MAQVPVPRSYSEILGDMIDAFLSRFGLRALKIGSPVLSMLESAAQSDLRSSEDIFELLEAVTLDQARGVALDRIGADERVPRRTESPASGPVTLSDSSIVKISTKVFQGLVAPIVGSLVVNVADASSFPATGSVYVGRGTNDFEGPLPYTSKVDNGTYWTLNLASGTLRFHNLGEPVVLAQGGNRTVAAGTLVQTPQGNVSNAVQFKVLYSTTIPDGEVSVDGVVVIAIKAGTTGNVIAGAINAFANGAPFVGAGATNPLPFTNGLASETDDSYRERIRQARQSRTRGTALALQTFSIGVTATDENKRVLSAAVVSPLGSPTVLYIDDGTGYEERSQGTAIESLTDYALGGEYVFKTSQGPLAKAYLPCSEVAPFSLAGGEQLAFTVGGVTTVHTFSGDEFRAIANATAFEVVASINADPLLNWSARTIDNGVRVAVFAKADSSEGIQYSPIVAGVDANAFLGFPSRRSDTMRLYLNDRLLTKDGAIATVTSAPLGNWGSLGPTEDLQLQVDGTPMANLAGGTYTFTAADFIAAGTGYTVVGKNTPAAWAAVFNYRIPGVTATVVNGLVVLTSNRSTSSRASLGVLGGSLVTKGMFALAAVAGDDSDYFLNRNTGELRLVTPLVAGDRLAAGTVNTRAFLQSNAFSTITVGGAGGHLFFALDGNAQIIPHGVTASTAITWSSTVEAAWSGVRQRMTSGTVGVFSNVKVGDWVVFWDPATPASMLDLSFRVAAVDVTSSAWVEFDKASATTPGAFNFPAAGLSFVRTLAQVQRLTVPAAANYTAASLAALFNLQNVVASVYQTQSIRVRTTTFSDVNGDVALVAADAEGSRFGLPVASATKNLTGHLASIESGASELGTPDFHELVMNATAATTTGAVTYTGGEFYTAPSSAEAAVWVRPHPDGKTTALTRSGQNKGVSSSIYGVVSGGGNIYTLDFGAAPGGGWFKQDRVYLASPYSISYADTLAVVVDEDEEQKRFVIPMWRKLKPVGTTYGTTNTYKDADNGNQSVAIAFGAGASGFDFKNFAVFMAARVKTHDQGDAVHYASPPADLSRTVLWRYYRLGADGNQVRVLYLLPTTPLAPVAWSINNITGGANSDVTISLASGAAKTGYALTASHNIGIVVTALASGVNTVSFLLGMPTTTAQRNGSGDVTITVNVAAAGATDHNLQIGNSVYVKNANGTYPDAAYTITARSATTFTYHDGGAIAGPTAIVGTVSYGPSEATLTGASPAVVVGDILSIGLGSSKNTSGYGMRIDTLVDAQTMVGKLPTASAVNTVVSWGPLGSLGNFAIFANASQSAAIIATAVNALANVPIQGTIIGSGAGIVDKASYAEAVSATAQYFAFTDGVNYVKVTTIPGSTAGDYQLQFKDPITAGLATNSDWANEQVRVVPRTALNVVNWLSAPAVSGLFTAAEVSLSSNAHKVQLASLTPGSAGSIQVQGGAANAVTAAVQGSAATTGTYGIISIRSADADGFMATGYVAVDAAVELPKPVFTAATVLTSIAASGSNWLLTIGVTPTFATSSGSTASALVSFERQGNFVAIHDTGLATNKIQSQTASEGDWVRITVPATTTYFGIGGSTNGAVALVNGGNVGIYRVVRVINNPDQFGFGGTIYVENAAAVDQALAECDVQFLTPDSIMPGDTLHISTSAWDGASSNQGVFTVVDVGNAGSGSFLDATKLTVSGTLSAVGSPKPALGTSYQQVQLVEGAPSRFFKRIMSVSPSALDSTLTELKVTTDKRYTRIGANAGMVLTALDKLGFSTDLANGVDGYQHQIGLLAEVNKVIYGDPSDSTTYPGVAAAGANINIQGPLVKRIQVTLSLRVQTGAPRQDVEDRVKSAVAAVINQAGIGESIALSAITDAASKVGGVVSVVMVNPVAVAGSDLISVQPYEKPLVLNVDDDVKVTFVGE